MMRLLYWPVTLPLCLLLAGGAGVKDDRPLKGGDVRPVVKMNLTRFEVTDSNLDLTFMIRNDSGHEVWICRDVDSSNDRLDLEVYRTEDGQILRIRRRLDVPTSASLDELPYGEYVRLNSGQTRMESLSLALPVSTCVKYEDAALKEDGYVTHLVVEIGFYNEDLPAMVRNILSQAEAYHGGAFIRIDLRRKIDEVYFPGISVQSYFQGLSSFNDINEQGIKEGRVLIPYTHQTLKGEQVLRVEVDGMDIPVKGGQ